MTESDSVPHLTPTERRIVLLVVELGGEPCTKSALAERLGRNSKTVDRLVSRLRREGILESRPCYDGNGGQLANSYRVADVNALAQCVMRERGR